MNSITIPLPTGVTKRALVTLLAASANNVTGATGAVLRRAAMEDQPVSEVDARAVVRFIRAWSAAELAAMTDTPTVERQS